MSFKQILSCCFCNVTMINVIYVTNSLVFNMGVATHVDVLQEKKHSEDLEIWKLGRGKLFEEN